MQPSPAEAYGSLKPPPLPQKRRHIIRKSEETDKGMTYDWMRFFLNISDDFREGTSKKNPWPLPLQLDKLKSASPPFRPSPQRLNTQNNASVGRKFDCAKSKLGGYFYGLKAKFLSASVKVRSVLKYLDEDLPSMWSAYLILGSGGRQQQKNKACARVSIY